MELEETGKRVLHMDIVNCSDEFNRVENVLWRLQNGELDFNVKLKAIVLFVGTNNTDCTPHEIYEGILEIIKEIKHKLGDVIIILPVILMVSEEYSI